MIHETAPKSRSESNDSLQSPDLNQMIRDSRSNSSASKHWLILWRNGLTDSAPFHPSLYGLFKIITSISTEDNSAIIQLSLV